MNENDENYKNVYFVPMSRYRAVTLSPPASAPSSWGPPPRPRDLGLTWGLDRGERRRARGRSVGTGSGKISWDWGRPEQQSGPPAVAEQGEAGAAQGQNPAAWRRRVLAPSGARRRSEGESEDGDLGKFLPEPPQISAKLTSGPGWCHHPVLETL